MIRALCIGAQSNVAKNIFTGQSVMFDGLVTYLNQTDILVTVVDISARSKSKSILKRSIDYGIVMLRITWLLIIHNYDICYITTAQSKKGFLRDYMMIGLCRYFKVKVIAHQFGANYNQLLDSLGKKGRDRLEVMLNYVSRIIVEGQYMKNQYSFMRDYDEKVVIIPNGLPTEGKNARVPKQYNGKEPFRLYYLSNLIWTKGYFDVLRAVDLLVNKYKKNIECVFAGAFMPSVDDEITDVSNKETFDKFVKDSHLEEVVSYYPGMYGEQKDKAFSKSNVFLLPTYYINEGQPVSIIEAMSYGCVPIVTYYRHIPMMINAENGCYVEAKRPEMIAENVVWLMEHPSEYATKSKECIRDYEERFTFDKYADRIIKCINEVVNC